MGGWAPRCETRATGKPASAESLQRVTRSRRAAADGDWEDLDARLDRLVLEPSPAAAAAARRAHRTPPARPRQPPPAPAAAAPRSNGRAGTPPPPDGGLVFDGAHVLEAHGLTSATTSTELEAWLESLDLRPLGPVLRRAPGARSASAAASGISRAGRGGLRAYLGVHGRPGVPGSLRRACRACGARRWVNEDSALAVFATPDDARAALARAPASGFRWRSFAQARHILQGFRPAPPAALPLAGTPGQRASDASRRTCCASSATCRRCTSAPTCTVRLQLWHTLAACAWSRSMRLCDTSGCGACASLTGCWGQPGIGRGSSAARGRAGAAAAAPQDERRGRTAPHWRRARQRQWPAGQGAHAAGP